MKSIYTNKNIYDGKSKPIEIKKNIQQNNKLRLKKILILISFIFVIFIMVSFLLIDSHTKELITYVNKSKSLKILDRDDYLIQEIIDGREVGKNVSLDEISDYFLNSIIVIEDKNYHDNSGVDIKRAFKCSITSLLHIEYCGGSTITHNMLRC